MAFGNQFHMPGSFHFEGPGASTTLNANMFRPPISPTTSTSTYNLAKSTGSLLSDNSMATNSTTPAPRLGRKRTHDESNSRGLSNLKMEVAQDESMEDDGSTGGAHRYTLAGQIETPGTHDTHHGGMLEDSVYSDVDYRRGLFEGSKRPQDSRQLAHAQTDDPINPRTAGWTTFAFQAIGGVVGKVWEFCRGGAGAFTGFQAGGGEAYESNGQPIQTTQVADPDSPLMATDSQECPNSPPGAYPESAGIEVIPNRFGESRELNPFFETHQAAATFVQQTNPFAERPKPASIQQVNPLVETHNIALGHRPNPFAENHNAVPFQQPNPFAESNHVTLPQQQVEEPSPDTTPDRPAAKRRQTGAHHENDELRRNWVMVDEDEPSPAATMPAFTPKKMSAPSTRVPAARRPNMASRLQQPRFSTPTASGRRISIPSPRFSGASEKSSIPMRASSRLSMASPAPASYAGLGGSPSLGREGASFASPRSPSQASMSSNPFTPTGSRIPQPRNGLGPNPFANTRTASPVQPRISPSRPSSRSSAHASPLHHNFSSRMPIPGGHSRSTSNVSTGSTRAARHSFGFDGAEAPPKNNAQASPRLDDEGRQLATKRFAVQRKNDSRLDRLNAELQGLIRQGQQALGTKFDVDMDEGWEEDT